VEYSWEQLEDEIVMYQDRTKRVMGRIRLLLAFLSPAHSLVAATVVPAIWATARQTTAAMPRPNAELLGRKQRFPSNSMSFAYQQRDHTILKFQVL